MFNLAIDSKLRGCDVVALKVEDVAGRHDPILKADRADVLDQYFAEVEVSFADDAGHFVHYECPDLAAREIDRFFSRRLAL